MSTLTVATTYTSLDGAVIELSPAPEAKAFSCVAHASFTSPALGRFEVIVGPRHLGRDLAFDPVIAVGTEIVDEYSFGGGALVMATGLTPPDGDGQHWEISPDGVAVRESMNLAIWEGQRFSFHTFRYGPPEPSIDRLLEVFDHLALDERPDGVIVRPEGKARFFLDKGPTIMQDVPDVALLEIRQLTQRNASVLPRGAGTRVPGGELFAHVPERDVPDHKHDDEHDGLHPDTFVYKVTPSAVVTILPHQQAGEETVMELATGLRADWTARADRRAGG